MPRIEWKDDDMAQSLYFFPAVGIVIGLICYGLYRLTACIELPLFVRAAILFIVPVAVTGGFHLDGFMDTEDALRSYKPADEKLKILKDPHVGAFAVIGLICVIIIMLSSVMVILDVQDISEKNPVIVYCAVFTAARALSGICALRFKKARPDGMLSSETANGKRKDTGMLIMLALQFAAACVVMFLSDIFAAAAVIIAFVICILYYRHMSYKNFGGVTGDTAGYFLTVSETAAALALAAAARLTY